MRSVASTVATSAPPVQITHYRATDTLVQSLRRRTKRLAILTRTERDDRPQISVVILHYGSASLLLDCVASVLRSEYAGFEVVVVDNHSPDHSAQPATERFGSDPRLRVIRTSRNLLYTGGNNAGLDVAGGDIVVFLNNDTSVDRHWLTHITRAFRDPAVGAVSPKILVHGHDGLIDNVGGMIDRFGFTSGRGSQMPDDGRFDAPADIAFASGACLAVRREAFTHAGGFDEWFGSNYEDLDASWRLRHLGFRVVSAPQAVVYHQVSASISRSAVRLEARHTMHFRTNRVAVHAKNAELRGLAQVCAAHAVYLIVGLARELLIDRSPRVAFTWVQASWRLLAHLPTLLRQRRAIRGREPARHAQVDAEMRALRLRRPLAADALLTALRRRWSNRKDVRRA